MRGHKKNSLVNFLGKILFSKSAPWQRRQKTLTVLWTLAVGVSAGGILLVVAYLMNTKR